MTSTLAHKPQWQRLFLRASGQLRETVKAFLKALTQPDPMEWETRRSLIMASRSQPRGTPKSVAPEVLSHLEQAKAEFEAAVRHWPRDREAEAQTWVRFRDAKCAQISAEIGR